MAFSIVQLLINKKSQLEGWKDIIYEMKWIEIKVGDQSSLFKQLIFVNEKINLKIIKVREYL